MKMFGIRMGGCELELENLIKDYLKDYYDGFKYLEIGAAGCVTLRAVYDIVKENIQHDNWFTIGIDIDGGWSLDWDQINKLFKKDEFELWTNRLSGAGFPLPKAQLWIDKNPRELVQTSPVFQSIDICFIDADHGYKEVIRDFKAVEDRIKLNGLVIFHDCGVLEQGTDLQPSGGFIDVRRALVDAGLMTETRRGWKFIKEIYGSRNWGLDGNSCGVFKKIGINE